MIENKPFLYRVKNPELLWPFGTIKPETDRWQCPVCGARGAVTLQANIVAGVVAATCGACDLTVVEPAFLDAAPSRDWRHILYAAVIEAGGPRMTFAPAGIRCANGIVSVP